MGRRRWARYPECFGPLNLHDLCDIARDHGMQIIEAYKPGMHVCNEIALYGNPEQMRAVDAAWTAAGHTIRRRERSLQFGVHLDCDRKYWIDKEVPKPEQTRHRIDHLILRELEENGGREWYRGAWRRAS